MKYAAFDIETTTYKSFGWKIGNPHDLRNFIVSYSMVIPEWDNDGFCHYYTEVDFEARLMSMITTCNMLVCHNAKFDILFLYIRYLWFRDWVASGGRIWCTMLAENIISGQRTPMMSLNDCSLKYGGTKKIDIVSKWWEQGMATEEMPKETLMEYNLEDSKNTVLVFENQLTLLEAQDQMSLVKRQMEDLLFLIVCEFNGMYVDVKKAKELKNKCLGEMSEKGGQIIDAIEAIVAFEGKNVARGIWNISSGDQRSAIFFGGTVKYKEKDYIRDEQGEVVCNKTKTSINYGEPKTKIYEKEVCIEGLRLQPDPSWKLAKEGYYSTDGKVMDILAYGGRCELAAQFKEYRKLDTLLTKYYNAIPDSVYEKDGCVHTQYKIDQETGRCGAVNPPLLTIPRDNSVKPMFVSRYDDGVIIQADMGQLEWRVAAYLSQDPAMKKDIKYGVDIHQQSASWAFKVPIEKVTKEQRTSGKAQTFGPLYGQGWMGLHMKTGLPIESCKAFLKGFYKKYKRLGRWHEELIQEIYDNQMGDWSWFQSPTGRIFWLQEGWNYEGNRKVFRVPQIKNLQVQGTATDILIIYRGILVRKLLPFRKKCHIINTIHDSIILDCREDIVSEVIPIISEVMEDPIPLNKVFKREFDIPLNVDISVGPSWSELREV